MSLVQAILIAIIAGVSRCEGDWLGAVSYTHLYRFLLKQAELLEKAT